MFVTVGKIPVILKFRLVPEMLAEDRFKSTGVDTVAGPLNANEKFVIVAVPPLNGPNVADPVKSPGFTPNVFAKAPVNLPLKPRTAALLWLAIDSNATNNAKTNLVILDPL